MQKLSVLFSVWIWWRYWKNDVEVVNYYNTEEAEDAEVAINLKLQVWRLLRDVWD